MKLPSLHSLFSGALFTLKRFPLVLLCAFLGTAVMIYLIDNHKSDDENTYLYHLLIVSSLGLTLFLALALYCETNLKSRNFIIITNLIGVALLVLYYILLPNRFEKIEVYRFFLFNIGLHLLVSFSPFIGQGSINGFWQFNKTFFLRILLSGLYSAVLFIGLALAILAVDQLFGVHIGDKNYARLWFFMVGVFNTWFFLAGVPKDLNHLNEETGYPNGLKIFTQYVLLPLVTIYLCILYAYTVKIAINWQLPKGWVSYLVISFSIAGILSLLLIYPIRNEEGNNWIKVFSRWFYRALYPLIFLLFIAIYKRVNEYGVTENRYYILVLAVWLACIAAYFLLSSVKNIKVIPVSLCLIAFLSSAGPLSSFSISRRSQVNRLEDLLIKNGILVNGKVTQKHAKISYKENARISSILQYIDQTHELYILQPWFTQPMDTILNPKTEEYAYKLGNIHKAMGIEYVSDYGRIDENGLESEPFYYYRNEGNYRAYKFVRGYDYLINVNLYNTGYSDQSFAINTNDTLQIKLDTINNTAIIQRNRQNIITLPFNEILRSGESAPAKDNYGTVNLDADKMIITVKDSLVDAKFEVQSINGKRNKNVKTIISAYGDLYLTLKDSTR